MLKFSVSLDLSLSRPEPMRTFVPHVILSVADMALRCHRSNVDGTLLPSAVFESGLFNLLASRSYMYGTCQKWLV